MSKIITDLNEIFSDLKETYRDFFKLVLFYWRLYGGIRALLVSPYFHLSLLLLFITNPYWRVEGWWETVIVIIPCIIGFSLGGYAIMMGMGDEKFRQIITVAKSEDEPSPYLIISSTFIHFVIVQTVALIAALIGKALCFYPSPTTIPGAVIFHLGLPVQKVANVLGFLGGMIGYWLFLYALILAFAAGFAVLQLSKGYDLHQKRERRLKEVNSVHPNGPSH